MFGERGFAPEGRGGDDGIDYTVDDNTIIFQYKFFSDGTNTSSRRRQIKRSFTAAMAHEPKEWVIVIPASLFRNPAEVGDKIATLQRAIDASDPDWTFDLAAVIGQIVQTLRPKDPNAALRSPVGITFSAVVPADSTERTQLDLSWDYGVVEPIRLSGSMVKDFKVTGPELVSFEGPVTAPELLPDPESASRWANTDMKVTDPDSKTLGTHLGRSRLLARAATASPSRSRLVSFFACCSRRWSTRNARICRAAHGRKGECLRSPPAGCGLLSADRQEWQDR